MRVENGERESSGKILLSEYLAARDDFFESSVFSYLVRAGMTQEQADSLVGDSFTIARREWEEAQAPVITAALQKLFLPDPKQPSDKAAV